jgi:CRISPR type I-E-associated protein CasB/Cse2
MSADATDWRDAVGKIAWRIGLEDYPAGSLAALRRLNPDKPDGAAFWWLVAEYAPVVFENDRAARGLAAIAQCMAIAHPFHRPLSGRRPLGEALAEADVSEARLLRLLRLPGGELPEELRRLARLMSSKGDAGRFDWSDAFALLYWADRETGERERRKIARDYYRKQYNLQKIEESVA